MSMQTNIFRQCIRKLRNWTGIVAGVGFAVFELISHRMGGSAINGKIVDGRYYLGEHGTFTEVTRATFAYLRWHEISLVAAFSLATILSVVSALFPDANKTPSEDF